VGSYVEGPTVRKSLTVATGSRVLSGPVLRPRQAADKLHYTMAPHKWSEVILNWTQTYGPLITVVAVAVEAIALVVLAWLEHSTGKKSVKLAEAALNLQIEVEKQRKTVESFVRIISVPGSNIEPARISVQLFNLNDTGIFWQSVHATFTAEGIGQDSLDIPVEGIVPAFEMLSFAIGIAISDKISGRFGPERLVHTGWRLEVDCSFIARGRQVHGVCTQENVVLQRP
jgi:hypothetical protein